MNPWPVVLLPALASFAGLLVGRDRRLSRAVAVGAGAMTLLLTLLAGPSRGRRPVRGAGPSIRTGELWVPLDVVTDPSRAAVAFIVALVALAVQVYSVWYLVNDDRYPVFAATVSLFTSAMLLVVHSGDLVLTLIGWEVMGWCSFLLIGHWSRRHSARRAAHKAFLVTRLADIGFLLGVIGLAAGARTTSLEYVVASWARPTACIDGGVGSGTRSATCSWSATPPTTPFGRCSSPSSSSGCWASRPSSLPGLARRRDGGPDARQRAHPRRDHGGRRHRHPRRPVPAARREPGCPWVLGISVSLTMVLAAALAFAQSDLKRLLAWSTVSQVGVMLSALAAAPIEAGPDAGLFHFWSHAVFKALLFLALGWAAVIAGGTTAYALRGSAAAAPLLRVSLLFGLLSLAGVPLVVGGLSKEHVVAVAWEGAVHGGPGLVVLVALLTTAALTGAYCTRAYLLLTAHVRPARTSPRLPPAVQAALSGLVLLSVLGGLVLLTDAFSVGEFSLAWVVITTLAVVVGMLVALRGGFDRDPAEVLVPRFIPLADRGLGADAAYRRVVADPVLALARLVSFLDTEVVDAYVRGTAVATRVAGWAGARAHHGERPGSAVGLVLAAVVLLGLAGVLAWS